jgi:hypothetical protein
MNERIRTLMEEAVSFRLDADSMGYEAQVSPEDLAAFAELIVRECAELADDGYGSTNFGNGICGAQVLKHFGVES